MTTPRTRTYSAAIDRSTRGTDGELAHIPTRGDRAWLPHTLAQSQLFLATAPDLKPTRIEAENRFGDKIQVDSFRTLTTGSDLPIFVAVIALAQKAGVRAYSNDGRTTYWTSFPVAQLYRLLGIDRRNQEWLYNSLYEIGKTSFKILYKNPEKHGHQTRWETGWFWRAELEKRKGRGGNILHLQLGNFLIPYTERYLFAQVDVAVKLKSDTGRGIYWALLCREALRASVEEWQKLLGGADTNPRRWRLGKFIPALRELEGFGYSWREEDDGEIIVRRPTN